MTCSQSYNDTHFTEKYPEAQRGLKLCQGHPAHQRGWCSELSAITHCIFPGSSKLPSQSHLIPDLGGRKEADVPVSSGSGSLEKLRIAPPANPCQLGDAHHTLALPQHTRYHCYGICSPAGLACLNRSADVPNLPFPASVY